jgi:hypothetical protein
MTQQIRIQATQDPAEVIINSVVAPWVSLQKAGAVAADVNKKMDQGKVNEALAVLDKTILELGQYGQLGAEAIKVLEEMKSKIANDRWSLRERKSSRYRSSSYLKMSSSEMWSHMSEAPPSFKQPKPTDPGTEPLVS